MNKYLAILAVCVLVLQIEIAALLYLDGLNLKVWHSQTQLNALLVDAATNQCML